TRITNDVWTSVNCSARKVRQHCANGCRGQNRTCRASLACRDVSRATRKADSEILRAASCIRTRSGQLPIVEDRFDHSVVAKLSAQLRNVVDVVTSQDVGLIEIRRRVVKALVWTRKRNIR